MEERAGRHWEKELIKAAAAARKRYVCSYGQGDLCETVCVHACRVCRSRRAFCVFGNPLSVFVPVRLGKGRSTFT